MHGIVHPMHSGPIDGVACLDGLPMYSELLAGEPQHLGHERKCLQATVLIECGEDLIDALHLDEFADS
jgi:hypothetical protein